MWMNVEVRSSYHRKLYVRVIVIILTHTCYFWTEEQFRVFSEIQVCQSGLIPESIATIILKPASLELSLWMRLRKKMDITKSHKKIPFAFNFHVKVSILFRV